MREFEANDYPVNQGEESSDNHKICAGSGLIDVEFTLFSIEQKHPD
ncbi:hypothetical protein ABLB84_00790 [Xenorhabdus szentirmaii]